MRMPAQEVKRATCDDSTRPTLYLSALIGRSSSCGCGYSQKKAEIEMAEFRTVKKCTSQLEMALGSCKDFLCFLDEEELIRDSVYNNLRDPTSNLSKDDKASSLVLEIRRVVKLKSENYHTIMKYLRSKDQYRDIVEILDNEYQKQLEDAVQPGRYTISLVPRP